MDCNEKYKDIIHLEHHVSKVHPQMPMSKRAAQFAPFSALTGYEEAQKESIRQNEERFISEESDDFY